MSYFKSINAVQSGTWNIATVTTLTGITNAVAVTGTFWQATQPVSNAGTFAVQATLSAETTKVIGVVRNADGSGNLLTSTSNALDINIKSGSIANTTFTATQATGTNLHTVVDSGTVTTVSTVTNLSQMGGVAISLNTGVRDTGTQRVTIATNDIVPASQSGTWNIGTVTTVTGITNVVHIDDNSSSITVDNGGTFAVQATLAAETTKVIGTVNLAASQTLATLTTITNSVTTTPLPTGKADFDLAFSASVPTGAQTGVSIDSDASTNRAVKEIYVGGNGFGDNAVVEFKRGATSIGKMYLIAKNFLVKDTLTYATSALTCDITTGNASTMTVYFDVKYYE